jgi:hypothetical protein
MPCDVGVEGLQENKTSVTLYSPSLFNLHVLVTEIR